MGGRAQQDLDQLLSQGGPTSTFSEKVNMLVRMVSQFRDRRENVVVFSNMICIQDFIAKLCTANKFALCEETASFGKAAERGWFVCSLSLKKHCEGLNLNMASRLILFELDWDSVKSRQAVRRYDWRLLYVTER